MFKKKAPEPVAPGAESWRRLQDLARTTEHMCFVHAPDFDVDNYAHLLQAAALFIEAANAAPGSPQARAHPGELLATPRETPFVLALYRDYLFVVFRSESTFDECFLNAQAISAAMGKAETGGNHAHRGFWHVAKHFPLALVLAALRQPAPHAVRGVFFVGHSVGGAVAQLVAARALQVLGAARSAFVDFCGPARPASAPVPAGVPLPFSPAASPAVSPRPPPRPPKAASFTSAAPAPVPTAVYPSLAPSQPQGQQQGGATAPAERSVSHSQLQQPAPFVGVITFGAPQAMCADLCRALGRAHAALFHHVVAAGDPVPLAAELSSRLAKKYAAPGGDLGGKVVGKVVKAAVGVPILGSIAGWRTHNAFKHLGEQLAQSALLEQQFYTYGVLVLRHCTDVLEFARDANAYAVFRSESSEVLARIIRDPSLQAATSIDPMHALVNYRTALSRFRAAPWDLARVSLPLTPPARLRTPAELEQHLFPLSLAGFSATATADLPTVSFVFRCPASAFPPELLRAVAVLGPGPTGNLETLPLDYDASGTDSLSASGITLAHSSSGSIGSAGNGMTIRATIKLKSAEQRHVLDGMQGVQLETVFGHRYVLHAVVFKVLPEYTAAQRAHAPPLCDDSPFQCVYNCGVAPAFAAAHGPQHLFGASHVCRFGIDCPRIADREHERVCIHVAKPDCPHITPDTPQCPYVSSAEHRMAYAHGKDPRGVWDFLALCPKGLACPLAADPQHALNFLHCDLHRPLERDTPYFDECPLTYVCWTDTSVLRHDFEDAQTTAPCLCFACRTPIAGIKAKIAVCRLCHCKVHRTCLERALETTNCSVEAVQAAAEEDKDAEAALLLRELGSEGDGAAEGEDASEGATTTTPATSPKADGDGGGEEAADKEEEEEEEEENITAPVPTAEGFAMGRGADIVAFGEEGKLGYGTLFKTLRVFAVQVAASTPERSAADAAATRAAARTLAALRHPCVLQFLGCCSATRGSGPLAVVSHALVFEAAPDGLLADRLYAAPAPLPPAQACAVARCLAHALAYLFEAGTAPPLAARAAPRGGAQLLCADGELVRPDAVFVANWAAGHVKLGCLTACERRLLRRRDAPAATPAPLPYAYAAPEHYDPALASTDATCACARPQDVFALGVLMWELAERQPAFAAMRMAAADVMEFVLGGERLAFSDPAHPLRAVAEQCWQQDPAARPSFMDVAAMLTP